MSVIDDTAPPGENPHAANSADVRYYSSILLDWWREIVLAVLLAALAGAALQWQKQPLYEAAADVVIDHADHPQTPAAPQVTVVQRGPSDERVASSAALLGLVHQAGVAGAVRERLGERLAGVQAVDLLEMITGDFVTYRGYALSDLIRITAWAGTPQDAADLATIWAEEYVASVNRLQRLEQGRLDALQAELDSALAASELSQRRLEAFLATDDSGALRRQSRANDSAVETLWEVRNELARAYRTGRDRIVDALSAPGDAVDVAAGSRALGASADTISVRAAIAELETENRALAPAIEAAENARRLLTAERDAVHSLVRSLRDEMARVKVRVAAASPRVRLASVALTPAQPATRSLGSAAAVVGLAALPTALLLAWFAHALGIMPLIGRFRPRRRQ